MLQRHFGDITIDDSYKNFLKNKRVAIVGPSSNTDGTKQCKLIESYDIVVRLNKTFNISLRKQVDIGKRTDILYNSMNTSDYPGENDFSNTLIRKLKDNNIKYIACPYPFIYPFDSDISKFISINNHKIPYHIMNLVLYKYLVNILQTRPYTGTCAILDLLNYPIKELYITGIDCYLNSYYKEYRKISNGQLSNLRNNDIHFNSPQLDFIKNLTLYDKRIKLDHFLEKYFFSNDLRFYSKINILNHIYKLDKKIEKCEKQLYTKRHIIYTVKPIYNEDYFIIKDSINYSNMSDYVDMYVNMNNTDNMSDIKINNKIKYVLDFTKNIKHIKLIKKNTDIKSIYIINKDIENYFIKNRLIHIMSYRCLIIIILTKLFHSKIFIDTTLMNDFTDSEKSFILYLQYVKKVSLINV